MNILKILNSEIDNYIVDIMRMKMHLSQYQCSEKPKNKSKKKKKKRWNSKKEIYTRKQSILIKYLKKKLTSSH